MRKTKHLFLALLAVTTLSTAWASELPGSKPDSNAAKSTYTVQWTGESNVIYTAQPQDGLTAIIVDGNSVTHNLTLTYTNGTEVIYAPNHPVNAGAWTVTANAPAGVTLENATAMLNIQPAPVYVTGAAAEIAKFADGSLAGVVTDNGVLNGVLGNDQVNHVTSAIFSDSFVGTGKTITLYYALTGDLEMLTNYVVTPSSAFYTDAGVVIPNIIPNNSIGQRGFELSAYGYCTGNNYSINYHLTSGSPDQYRIDFSDARFVDVNWADLATGGANGTINITIPDANVPAGDYTMDVYFRDSRYPALESSPVTLNFHVNLPATYTMPLFDNVIALVDTCNCFTDIQWYHNGTAIPGANGYFYREEGGLTGEYFVSARMNGVQTYTCPQTDMNTLISDGDQNVTVSAYPNPTAESVIITIEGSENALHTFRVLNTLGVEMMRGAFEGDNITIDMRAYQHGNYMVNVDGVVVRVIRN
jgi:hypothetical protein